MSSTTDVCPELESAGRDLWESLLDALTPAGGPEAGGLFPEHCDLRGELRAKSSEPLDEVVQHLRDLGYLKGKVWVNSVLADYSRHRLGPGDEKLLADALSRYHVDQDRCRNPVVRPPDTGGTAAADHSAPEPAISELLENPLLVRSGAIMRLRALTSLDGNLTFSSVPEPGETSLGTRVIHHLLLLYGLLPEGFPPDAPYGPVTEAALRGLADFRGLRGRQVTVLEIINGLADFDTVAQQFAAGFEGRDLSIPGPDAGQSWNASYALQDEANCRFEKKSRTIMDTGRINWQAADWNSFGIRFLQLYLWHRGHYLGPLDQLWGPLCQNALITAVQAHATPGESAPESRFFTVEQRDGSQWYRLDVAALIRHCEQAEPLVKAAAAPAPADLLELQTSIRDGLDALQYESTPASERDTEEVNVWNQLFQHLATIDQTQQELRGKRNYAMSMVGRGIARLAQRLRQIVRWVKRRIRSFVERVRNFTRHLLEEITGAVLQAFRFLKRSLNAVMHTATQATRRLLRLLTGAPFVSVIAPARWLVTKFAVDQDAVTLLGPGIEPDDIGLHFRQIAEENRALETTLRLGVIVLKLVAVVVPPLGPIIAVRLALDVFRAVWAFCREQAGADSAGWPTAMLTAT